MEEKTHKLCEHIFDIRAEKKNAACIPTETIAIVTKHDDFCFKYC